uniref:Reverse transcriptase domain-containing protein n=2 Tax=Clastoptera arizonana TaxID=38151 RepID=A0A1B6DHM9_9HEMI
MAQSMGTVTLEIEIGNIKENFLFFIIKSDNFKEDLLLGLDCIQKFKLCQDENLKITQKYKKEEKVFKVNMTTKSETDKQRILHKYKEIFAKSKFDVGVINGFEATIPLKERKYISRKPYKCSVEDKIEIEKQIKELLANNLTTESYSPYGAPVTLVLKRDEEKKSRLCIDYRELNKQIIPESQPFPRIEDLTIRARNCNYFTKLDVNSAFWSIPVREKDRFKTAFVTHHGHSLAMELSTVWFKVVTSNIPTNNG